MPPTPQTGCCFSHSCESNEYLVPSQFSQVTHLSKLCIWFAEHIWLACTLPRNRSFWIISWRNKAPMQDMRTLKSEQASTSEALHEWNLSFSPISFQALPSHIYMMQPWGISFISSNVPICPNSCLHALTMMMDNEDNPRGCVTCLECYTQGLL